MPFKDLPEGQTHYYGDGCGEPAHNPAPFTEKDFIEEQIAFDKGGVEAVEELRKSKDQPAPTEEQRSVNAIESLAELGVESEKLDWGTVDFDEIISLAVYCAFDPEGPINKEGGADLVNYIKSHTVPLDEYTELQCELEDSQAERKSLESKLAADQEVLVRLPIEHAAIQGALDQEIAKLKGERDVAQDKLAKMEEIVKKYEGGGSKYISYHEADEINQILHPNK